MDKQEISSTEVRPSNASSTTSQPPRKAAFVHKLYAMLNDPSLSRLIWWCNAEGVFALMPCTEFAQALTSYFKHGNVSSFVRQLHMYGFHKVFDEDQPRSEEIVWEFKHSSGLFRKGDEGGLSSIKRRSSNKTIADEEVRWTPGPSMHPQALMTPQGVMCVGYQPHPHQQPMFVQQPVYLSRPTTPVTSAQQMHQIAPPQPHIMHAIPVQHSLDHPSHIQQDLVQVRNMSVGVPPEKVEGVNTEILNQQRFVSHQSDPSRHVVRSTSSDSLKLREPLPKLAPVVQGQGLLFKDSLGSLHTRKFTNGTEQWSEQAQQLQYQPQMQQGPPIHFWESTGNGPRQRSVFVDPLASPMNTGDLRPSSLPLLHSGMLQGGPPSSPHHLQQGPYAPHPQRQSLPAHFQPGGSHHHRRHGSNASPSQVIKTPPRSIPDERHTPIPNISHLQSQIRPSLIEYHHQIDHLQGSLSSQSTLYSTQSSISSMSSRNSQTSIQGLSTSKTLPTLPIQSDNRNSVSTIRERNHAKVAVSSLLESPKSQKRPERNELHDEDDDRELKKSKSSLNLK